MKQSRIRVGRRKLLCSRDRGGWWVVFKELAYAFETCKMKFLEESIRLLQSQHTLLTDQFAQEICGQSRQKDINHWSNGQLGHGKCKTLQANMRSGRGS